MKAIHNGTVIMKNRNRVYYEIGIFLLLVVLLTANVVYWGGQKDGFHLDEMFSYTHVGNTKHLKIFYKDKYLNNWHDVSYFKDFLIIDDQEAFDLKGAWELAYKNDAHPPLYYATLDAVTSLFFRNQFTKWSGICTNIPFYILSLIILYLLSKKLFRGRIIPSLVAVAIYGISVGAVSSVTYIRMYMMVTFFSLVLIYLNTILMECTFGEPKDNLVTKKSQSIVWVYAAIFLTIMLGSLTHYYFLIFAFFTCGVFLLWFLKKKKWMSVAIYGITGCMSVLACIALCPDFLRDLLSGNRGKQAIEQAQTTTGWLERTDAYVKLICNYSIGKNTSIVFLLFLLALILIVVFFRKKNDLAKEKGAIVRLGIEDGVIISYGFVIVAYMLTVALVAPYERYRYIMILMPGIALLLVYFIDRFTMNISREMIVRTIAYCTLFSFVISAYFTTGVGFLYRGYNEQMKILENHRPYKAIIITDKKRDSDYLAQYLISSEAVYQTASKDIMMLENDKGEYPKETIVFISKNTDISVEDALEQIHKAIGSKDAEKLFCTIASPVYAYRLIW